MARNLPAAAAVGLASGSIEDIVDEGARAPAGRRLQHTGVVVEPLRMSARWTSRALERAGGNKASAAWPLGITRRLSSRASST